MNAGREPLLFTHYPGLRGKVDWMGLGSFPTPVHPMTELGKRLGCSNLFVKRDDQSGTPYGGNKVRKLEFTLADAVSGGANPVITVGAVGSNHLLATTVYAKQVGLDTVGIVIPQPVQEYLRTNVLCNAMLGCRLEPVGSSVEVPVRLAEILFDEYVFKRRRPYLLWAGGSSILGTLGYVEAGLEIARQVREGQVPEPDYVFVPVGSSGTLAGLVLGLRLAGLSSRAVGVRVYDKPIAGEYAVAVLANLAGRYLRRRDRTVPKIKIRPRDILMLHDCFGGGYAHFTRKGVKAVELLKELENIKLEGTYSGKNMAGFMEFMTAPGRRDAVALFINTYNSVDLSPLLEGCPGPDILPPELRGYFDKPIAPVEG